MKNRISSFIIVLMIPFLAFGQTQVNEPHNINDQNPVVTAANFNTNISKLADNPFFNQRLLNLDWTYCTSKYAVDIKVDNQELSGSVSFRMKKDSIIWFSVSAIMGIQILKGIINRDSAHILDVYNQKYYALSIEDLNRMQELPANLSAIQALIVGSSPTSLLKFQDSVLMNNEYLYNWTGTDHPFTSFSATSKNKIFTEARFVDKGRMRKLTISYLDRSTQSEVAIPYRMSWKIADTKSDLNNLQLELTLKTARFDAIPSYPFTVPEDYERVSIQKN
jgi:hypothetical protein